MTKKQIRDEIRRLAVEITCYTHPRHRRKIAKLEARNAELQRLLLTCPRGWIQPQC